MHNLNELHINNMIIVEKMHKNSGKIFCNINKKENFFQKRLKKKEYTL